MQDESFLQQLKRQSPRKELLKLKQSALLVMDMQEYFRPLTEQILPRLVELIAACRQAKMPVIYTQHGHRDPSVDGGMLAQWWRQLILTGTSDARLMPEIAPRSGDKKVVKNRYSAFYETDLEKHLLSKGIRDLLIGGVMTNLCCETTARDAFVRDFRVFFLEDGTATSDRRFQVATLTNLAYGFAHLVTCRQMVTYLKACR